MGKGSSDTKLRKRSRRADDSTTPVTPSPVSIPPLLSPTLPPALAGDFARSGRDKPACLEKKETFIVTLKYNKWNAGAVQRILRKPLHGVPECPLFRDDSLPLRGYSENLFWASYFLSQPGPFSLSQIAVKTKKHDGLADVRKSPSRCTSETTHRDHPSSTDSGYGTTSVYSCRSNQVAPMDDAALLSGLIIDQPGTLPDLVSFCAFTDDADKSKSAYPSITGVSESRVDSFAGALAQDILGHLDATALDDTLIDRLCSVLPDLLTALALRIGYDTQSQECLNVMLFICTYRSAIADSFRYHCARASLHPGPVSADAQELLTAKIMDGSPHSTDEVEQPPHQCAMADIEEELEISGARTEDHDDFDLPVPPLEDYTKLISGNTGLRWLLDRLRREILLSEMTHNFSETIRDATIRFIPRTRPFSRYKSAQGCTVVYSVDWAPMAFFDEQNYDEPPSVAVAKVITITGSRNDAQALSCQEYLAQTWPQTGQCTMKFIQNLLSSDSAGVARNVIGGLILFGSIVHSNVVVEASGVPHFVAEIGEQLAWLGAVLRPSPFENEAVSCTPFTDWAICAPPRDYTSDDHLRLQCSIKFEFNESVTMGNGQCWHDMFQKQVIARGFPILRRLESHTGLEIPLTMMAILARTRYVNTFKSKIFIKGFSTMLVPVKRSGKILIWHLLHTKRPHERISYLDCALEHADVSLSELESARHIVGWCSEAVVTAGTSTATCTVKKSGLPVVHGNCTLEKFEVSAGQLISGTAVFTLGDKEKPVHVARSGYLNQLQWISSKHIVLWDEGDKRGWLVNGATALLHILRASLEHSKRKFGSAFLLDTSCLGRESNAKSLDTALSILTDPAIRDFKLYVDKSEVYDEETNDGGPVSRTVSITKTRYYRLEDRIEHIYNILEKLIDHQADAERRSGLKVKPRPRRFLEGWDFRDLVMDGDPFFPRVSTLQTIGKGWVDFIRGIRAVTLFGRGFGELIRPGKGVALSCPWSSVPRGKFFLAAHVQDLQQIMDDDGDSATNPRQLCDNVLWYMKQSAFKPCPCNGGGSLRHHDPVQALFPSRFRSLLRKKPPARLELQAAVIFGHNMNLHWHWRDNGDPVKGDPPPEIDYSADPFDDSGLGSSVDSASNLSLNSGKPATPPSSDPNTSGSDECLESGPSGQAGAGTKRRLRDVMSSISKRARLRGIATDLGSARNVH